MTDLAALERTAGLAWWTFAPAVLAADGDPAKQDAALKRPGVRTAFELYHDVTAKIAREARRTRGEAMLEYRDAIGRITQALDWAA